jgi:hypothetical protein
MSTDEIADFGCTKIELIEAVHAGANRDDVARIEGAVWRLFDRVSGLRYFMDARTSLLAELEGEKRQLRAAVARLDELERENARLKTPEWFYNADDGECTYGDVNDVAEGMDHEGVMRVCGAREVWKKWAAVRCVALDADGDVDETEIHTFDTESEALRCWPESLAAARAALAGNGEK